MTIRFPAEPVSGMPYQRPTDDVPGERPPVVRRESDQERGYRLAAFYRSALREQQLSGSFQNSRTRSFLRAEVEVPGGIREEVDWASAHNEPDAPLAAPDEITVQRVADTIERDEALSARIDALKASTNSPWRPGR